MLFRNEIIIRLKRNFTSFVDILDIFQENNVFRSYSIFVASNKPKQNFLSLFFSTYN